MSNKLDASKERRLAHLLAQSIELNQEEKDAFLGSLKGADTDLKEELIELLETPIPDAPPPDTLYAALRLAARAQLQADAISVEDWKDIVASIQKAPGALARLHVQEQLGDTERCSVHAAYDLSMHRRVALKQLKQSLADTPYEATVRFVREIALMADLRHPHILPLLDYGVSEGGFPYFTTYLMEGKTLAEGLGKPLTGSELRKFVGRVATICDAVESAHKAGYLHRDIKPENILLDSGEGNAYLSDWGVACDRHTKVADNPENSSPKLQSGSTIYGEAVGTLWYMSPEQARGDVQDCDARSDVYSLGAILYEGLRGAAPLELELGGPEKSVGSIARSLGSPPPIPPPPSAPKELSSITLKALSVNRDGRYSSALVLSEDLRAWLENRPVAAQGNGIGYRLKKRIQRHPSISAAAMLVLLLGGLGLGIANSRIQGTNERLRSQSVTSGSLVDFLTKLFERANAGAHPNKDLSARDILEAGSIDIESALLDAPVARARMQLVIGENLRLVQSTEAAHRNINEAFATLMQSTNAEPLDRLMAASRWAAIVSDPEEIEEAYIVLSEQLNASVDSLPRNMHSVLDARKMLGILELRLKRPKDARVRFEQLALDMQSADIPTWQKLEVQFLLVTAASEQGDHDTAILQAKALLEDYDMLMGEFHPRSGPARQFLAGLYSKEQRFAEAVDQLEDYLTFQKQYYDPDHPNVLVIENSRINTLMQAGQHVTALPGALKLYETTQRVMGKHSPPALHSGNNYAICLAETGNSEAAVICQREIFEGWKEALPKEDPFIERARMNLASALIASKKTKEALALCEEAESNLPPGHDFLFHAKLLKADCMLSMGDSGRALSLLKPLQTDCLERFGKKNPHNRRALRLLSQAYRDSGQLANATSSAKQLVEASAEHPTHAKKAENWLQSLSEGQSDE